MFELQMKGKPMSIQLKAGRIAARGLLAASCLTGTYAASDARSVIATPVRSEAAATLQGVVSVRESSRLVRPTSRRCEKSRMPGRSSSQCTVCPTEA
jgi:hypothetical protein